MKAHERFYRLLVQFLKPIIAPEYDIDIAEATAEDGLDESLDAVVSVNTTYLFANIRMHPNLQKQFRAGMYRYIGEVVVHEMAHILTWELLETSEQLARDDQAQQHTQNIYERTTQRITNSLMRLLGDGWADKIAAEAKTRRRLKV
jgi:hypothetical protein